ncbi:hypothetical protein [Paenarthrobacter histidinolovorans]|uniref:hypothetical protein n=1 Tax=Paenarthrobacter histidinolovorans TaxID=43664 RepID=UPI0027E3FDE2|nr:hypothetical protein [Paenarthrobacter histidinolovorans]
MTKPETMSVQQAAGLLPQWRRRYARRLRFVDAAVVAWAVVGAFGVRFGFSDLNAQDVKDGDYIVFSAVLAVAWWLMLEVWGSREAKILGSGSEEYKRVIAASAWLFGFVAIFSYALKNRHSQGLRWISLPGWRSHTSRSKMARSPAFKS